MENVVRKWQDMMLERTTKTGNPIWDLYINQWGDKELYCDLHYIIKQSDDDYELVEKLTKYFKDHGLKRAQKKNTR